MELRHLRYFVAVAEELNFTRAAKRLRISQPPLSLQIQQLEKEIGAPLFYRHTQGVELTNAGKLMLEEARIILKQVETAKTSVRRRGRGETGRLNVGSSGGTYFHPLIPTIIREYGMKYPDIVIAPEASNSALLVAQVRAEQIDIAFIRLPIGDSGGLAIEPLVDENAVMVLPAGHPLTGSASAPLAALAKETFILWPREFNPGAYDSVIAACHRAGFSPVLGQAAPEIVSVIPLVAAGLGVGVAPRSTVRLFAGGFFCLPIEGNELRTEIGLVYRRDDRSTAVHNFVAVAHRAIGQAI